MAIAASGSSSAALISASLTGVARPLAMNETLRSSSLNRDAYSSATRQPWECATTDRSLTPSAFTASCSQSAMASMLVSAGPSECVCPGRSGTSTL